MKNRILAASLAVALLSACAITKNVRPVAASNITEVCIKTNPQVMMGDFLKELRSQVEQKGIKTSIYDGERPASCRHHLDYTANWRWDLAMYMVFAEINVYENGAPIGQATYDAHGGGLNLEKFGRTADKLKVMVDELFAKK